MATLGLYVTTKGIPGQTPKILDTADGQTAWIIGRSKESATVVMPHRFISREHGWIVYDEVKKQWVYRHIGENANYFSKGGADLRRLQKGQEIVLEAGDSVFFLFKQPMYCLEFLPGISKAPIKDDEPTASAGHSYNDISYIDTRWEFFAYLLKTLVTLSNFKFLMACITVGLCVYAWIKYR